MITLDQQNRSIESPDKVFYNLSRKVSSQIAEMNHNPVFWYDLIPVVYQRLIHGFHIRETGTVDKGLRTVEVSIRREEEIIGVNDREVISLVGVTEIDDGSGFLLGCPGR